MDQEVESPNTDSPIFSRIWLQEEFLKRKERNSLYSLRAFSNFLNLPSGRVSEILSNKRLITRAVGERVADRLGLDPLRRTHFLDCIQRERKQRGKGQTLSEPSVETEIQYSQISQDVFHLISDWYHFAILSLMKTRGYRDDSVWISKRIGISSIEARSAMDRLLRLKLIEKKKGRFVPTTSDLTTTHEVSSSALRKSHKQTLELASQSLEEVPVQNRDITAMTMSIDVSKLPLAKKMIKDFRRKLCSILESENKTEVYNLNIQLFPLTKTKITQLKKGKTNETQ